MTVNELTKEIYKKYPLVYKGMEKALSIKIDVEEYSGLDIYFNIDNEIVFCYLDDSESLIPFNMLYGLLEDFFMSQNIFLIDILNDMIDEIDDFDLYEDIFKSVYSGLKYKTILKASEILEGKL